MTRALVAFLAAFEAAITAAIGVGVALAPLTVVWAVQYKMAISWAVFWRAATDAWLLGLGVDLHVHLDRVTALSLGLSDAVPPFTVTVAALGVSLFTVMMGARIGRRAAETPFLLTGAVSSVVVFALIAWLAAGSAQAGLIGPVTGQAALVAGAVFAAGVVLGIGLDWARNREDVPAWFGRLVNAEARAVAGAALRAATGAVALLVAAAATLVAFLLLTHFGRAVALYEALQAGVLGGATLTLAQLAFLPNAIVWTASWLIGPGFHLGSSVVAPGTAAAGQLPGVPLIAIVPSHTAGIAVVGVAVPLLAGAVSGFLTHRGLAESGPSARPAPSRLALTAVGAAVAGGAVIVLLAWWSGGSLAPGSLARLGPDPLLVGVFGALELGVGVAVGLVGAHFRSPGDWFSPTRPRREESVPERELV